MANPELWCLVPSVPGLLASSYGRILVVPKFGELPNGGQRQYGSIARKGSWDGERYILQWQAKTYKIARLVCEAFHGPAPEGMNICMHLDENSRNNLPDNLKWGTQKQNLNAPGFIKYCEGRTGKDNPYLKGRVSS